MSWNLNLDLNWEEWNVKYSQLFIQAQTATEAGGRDLVGIVWILPKNTREMKELKDDPRGILITLSISRFLCFYFLSSDLVISIDV